MSAQIIEDRPQVTTEGPATPASQGRLRGAWRRVRNTVADMNYASRRIVELNATVDR
jgi:hypothetical protein